MTTTTNTTTSTTTNSEKPQPDHPPAGRSGAGSATAGSATPGSADEHHGPLWEAGAKILRSAVMLAVFPGALLGLTDGRSVAAAVALTRVARPVLAAVALLAVALVPLAATPAYAQQTIEGCGNAQGGQAIISTLQNAQSWIAFIVVILAGIGFIVSVCIKAVAGTNQSMHQLSHTGMFGSAIAAAAGLLTPDIIDLVKTWTGAC